MPTDEMESVLEIYELATGVRTVVHRSFQHFEAPNWSRDGLHLIINGGGRLYRVKASGGGLSPIDTGHAVRCNNDHGLSPDGAWLAISHEPEGASLIYVLPSGGGEPRLVTTKGPSYWHGWSPDGSTLAYCAEREGRFGIFTIPVIGGEEQRLTSAIGLDDGPDYAPSGAIFFNSDRTGAMRLWRVDPDGANLVQVTSDDAYGDWFPHPSPDGKWLVFLSYDRAVQGHPPNRDVVLRLMPQGGGKPEVLVDLFGGQGTINVPSWSPDGASFAFVSYRRRGARA